MQRRVRGTTYNKHKMKTGTELIAEERARQIQSEGWTADHDDGHRRLQMTRAAACYLLNTWEKSKLEESATGRHVVAAAVNVLWPWEQEWWKPSSDPVRNLVKAGALIAAELDRLQRASNS